MIRFIYKIPKNIRFYSNKSNIHNDLIKTLTFTGEKIINNLNDSQDLYYKNEDEQEEIKRLDEMSKLHLEGED